MNVFIDASDEWAYTNNEATLHRVLHSRHRRVKDSSGIGAHHYLGQDKTTTIQQWNISMA